VVIEHDPEIIDTADRVIDLGSERDDGGRETE
jgi:excinuclease UvrABC ATPase subunit